MTCCGRRSTTSPGAPATPARAIRVTASGYGPPPTVTIRYLRTQPIVVQGTATGRRYGFSGGAPIQPVDARDAAALLRSGLFR